MAKSVKKRGSAGGKRANEGRKSSSATTARKKGKGTARKAAAGWSGPLPTITKPASDDCHVAGAPLATGTVDQVPIGMSAQIDVNTVHPIGTLPTTAGGTWSYQILDAECPPSATHEYLLTVRAWNRNGPGQPVYRWFYRDS